MMFTFNESDVFLRYVTHSRNLRQYLEGGLKLRRVRRALKFRQSKFIRGFVEKMTARRKASKGKVWTTIYKVQKLFYDYQM